MRSTRQCLDQVAILDGAAAGAADATERRIYNSMAGQWRQLAELAKANARKPSD